MIGPAYRYTLRKALLEVLFWAGLALACLVPLGIVLHFGPPKPALAQDELRAPVTYRPGDPTAGDTVSIEEDADTQQLCLQWNVGEDADGALQYEWRCRELEELRLEWFPEAR